MMLWRGLEGDLELGLGVETLTTLGRDLETGDGEPTIWGCSGDRSERG